MDGAHTGRAGRLGNLLFGSSLDDDSDRVRDDLLVVPLAGPRTSVVHGEHGLARADPVPRVRARFRAAHRELFGRRAGRMEELGKRERPRARAKTANYADGESMVRQSRKRLERRRKK